MIEEKTGDLLNFIVESGEPLRVLVIESPAYLRALRKKLPHADIYLVTSDEYLQAEEQLQGMKLHWLILDYLSEPLPFEHEYFDIIMGDQLLLRAGNPQDIASGLGLYIKDTGCFMTTFTNARYWKNIRHLKEGHFYHVCTHVFSKNEMLTLLYASFYKEAAFGRVEDDFATDKDFIAELEKFGFENIDGDLGVRTWMVMATKSTPEILDLKRLFTKEIRRELVNRLRRVEFDIDVMENTAGLVQLWDREKLFAAYLDNFIKETIMHTERFLGNIIPALWTLGRKNIAIGLIEEMAAAYDLHQDYKAVLKWQALVRDDNVPKLEENMTVGSEIDKAMLKQLPPEKRIAFITCVNSEMWYHECQLYIKHLAVPDGMAVEFIPIWDAQSMCQGYNKGMNQTDAKYKVYIHQDTLIVNHDFLKEMLKIFSEKSVGGFGVIGCRKLPATGIWWDGMRCVGRVLHACEAESVVDSICQEVEEPFVDVEAVDGLMLVTQYDVPWREDLFTGWHFYEIAQCKELQRRGYEIVVPHQDSYWCIHSPKEKPLDPSYEKYKRIFLKEYGAELEPEI